MDQRNSKYFRYGVQADGKLNVYATDELLHPHGDELVMLEVDPSGEVASVFWETTKTCGEQDMDVEAVQVDSVYDIGETPLSEVTVDTPILVLSQYKFKENK